MNWLPRRTYLSSSRTTEVISSPGRLRIEVERIVVPHGRAVVGDAGLGHQVGERRGGIPDLGRLPVVQRQRLNLLGAERLSQRIGHFCTSLHCRLRTTE